MLSLFKNKNRKNSIKEYSDLDRVAENIAYRCIGVQVKLSKFIGNRFDQLSTTTKKLLVIAFCFLSFSSCLYVIIESFFTRPNSSLSIVSIRHPRQSHQNMMKPSISKKEFEMIGQFKRYLDSLADSKSGKKIYDSITLNRPGLIDSLSMVENLYQLQSSK